MPDLSKMNEAQRRAVLHGEGPMLVLAGPGSGKTYTITSRIAYLMEHYRVAPENILVITFTKEAALSMQERFGSQSHPHSSFIPVTFGTFHSIFYQIIRHSQPSKSYQILTDIEKRNIILPVLKKQNREMQARPKEILNEEAGALLGAISYYKNTEALEQAAQRLNSPLKEEFPRLLQEYEKARARSGRLDFDDMLFLCRELLSGDKHLLEVWQKRFRYILIDEFQDINPIQYKIIRMLCAQPCNLFAVGDDDQSIYGFRGSEPSLMRRFLTDYPMAVQVLLSVNYRSRPKIVETSMKVIACNRNRFEKDLTACDSCNTEVKEERNFSGELDLRSFDSREMQYDYLVKSFLECDRKGMLGNCAVLFRTNMQMQLLAARLKRERIPYVMKEKSFCIYDHFVGEDISGFVWAALGDRQRSNLLRIINKPFRWIPREALTEEHVNFREVKAHLEGMEAGIRKDRIMASIDKLERDLNRMGGSNPYLGMQLLRKSAGYEKYLCQKADGDNEKLTEWMEILDYLTQEAKSFSTYDEWMAFWEICRLEFASGKDQDKKSGKGEGIRAAYTEKKGADHQNRDKIPEMNSREKSCIRLMTAHGSKGLEFTKVFIPDINEGIYPHGKMAADEVLEEERRILYVAMTRAKEALELLWVKGTREHPAKPSRFLAPLLEEQNKPK